MDDFPYDAFMHFTALSGGQTAFVDPFTFAPVPMTRDNLLPFITPPGPRQNPVNYSWVAPHLGVGMAKPTRPFSRYGEQKQTRVWQQTCTKEALRRVGTMHCKL